MRLEYELEKVKGAYHLSIQILDVRNDQEDYELLIYGTLAPEGGMLEEFEEKMVIKPGNENKLEKILSPKTPADMVLSFFGKGECLGVQMFELG